MSPRLARAPFPHGLAAVTVAAAAFLLISPSTFGTVNPASTPSGWAQLFPTVHPSNKSGFQLAYDAKDGYVVGFGGRGGGFKAWNQTWIFAGGNWTELFPRQVPVFGGSLVYDNATQQTIKFGGFYIAGYYRGLPLYRESNTTWAFAGGNWSQLHPRHSPPAGLGFASITYDPVAHELVLYGMLQSRKNGSWIWQLWEYTSADWRRVVMGSQLPLITAIAYDPAYRGVVGAGTVGRTNNTFETWLWRNGSWSPLALTEPVVSAFPGPQSLVYDPVQNALVFATTGTRGFHMASMQTWLLSHGQWRESHSGQVPRTRYQFGMAFDGTDNYVVMFGGYANGGLPFHQTWVFT